MTDKERLVELAERAEATRRDIADRLTPNALFEVGCEVEWTRRTLHNLSQHVVDLVAALRARASEAE